MNFKIYYKFTSLKSKILLNSHTVYIDVEKVVICKFWLIYIYMTSRLDANLPLMQICIGVHSHDQALVINELSISHKNYKIVLLRQWTFCWQCSTSYKITKLLYGLLFIFCHVYNCKFTKSFSICSVSNGYNQIQRIYTLQNAKQS